jgi:hypothetical protein
MNTLLGKLHSSGNNPDVHRENNLSEVTGIPELMNLYYDSEYDYATGEFHGMTTKTQRRFQIDLEDFYKVFTQSKNMPSNITSGVMTAKAFGFSTKSYTPGTVT